MVFFVVSAEWAKGKPPLAACVLTAGKNSEMHFGRIRYAFGVLGDWFGCHQLPERSFNFRGTQCPVCARCTGVFAGQSLMLLGVITGIRLSVLHGALFMLPMAVDWLIQYVGIKESTNSRRVITGLLGGAGYVVLIVGLASIGIKKLFHQASDE